MISDNSRMKSDIFCMQKCVLNSDYIFATITSNEAIVLDAVSCAVPDAIIITELYR